MKWITRIALALFVLVALYGGMRWSGLIGQPKPSPVIAIAQGELQGVMSGKGGKVAVFNGVPYAAPPVGELRWKPPAAAPGWQGVRDAREFGPDCMQTRGEMGSGFIGNLMEGQGIRGAQAAAVNAALSLVNDAPMSEDCLYLNIRTPNLNEEGEPGEPLPVMVWIHGGGHQWGSGSTVIYNTDALPERGVVLVTINYRLGALGYFAHPALSAESPHGASGNYGLLDQIAALAWVRDNIAAFGGDPANVTIFGESAGAHSVAAIMASPLGEGLYHKAILQSGGGSYDVLELDLNPLGFWTAHESGAEFATRLGLAGADATAEELRAVPAQTLIETADNDLTKALHTIADGWALPVQIGAAFASGAQPPVPMLIGYNADEGSLFYPDEGTPTIWIARGAPTDMTEEEGLRAVFGERDADRLIELYGMDEDWAKGASLMFGDDVFGVHARYLATQQARQGGDAYLYYFTRIPPSENAEFGAFHGAEIPFVFDSHNPLFPKAKDDEPLIELMGAYWTNFAKTGDPNGPGLPQWPLYSRSQEQWMVLDKESAAGPVTGTERLDILESRLRRTMALAESLRSAIQRRSERNEEDYAPPRFGVNPDGSLTPLNRRAREAVEQGLEPEINFESMDGADAPIFEPAPIMPTKPEAETRPPN